MLQGFGLVAVLLFVAAVLLAAELLLPTHGVLGVLGAGAAVAAVIVCGRQSAFAGLALLVVLLILSPVLWTLSLRIWPYTPVGRRIILPPAASDATKQAVCVGQEGVAISELRPMGTCEFAGQRIEAMSEFGLVPAGSGVRVVALVNNRPTVRSMI